MSEQVQPPKSFVCHVTLSKVVLSSPPAASQEAEGPLSLGPSVWLWSSAEGVHGSWALSFGGGLAAALACRFWTQLQSNLQPHGRFFTQEQQKPRSLTGEWLRQWRRLTGPAETDARDNLYVLCGADAVGNQKSCTWEAFAKWRHVTPRNPWRTTGGWTES